LTLQQEDAENKELKGNRGQKKGLQVNGVKKQ
jgi:hypothetical protein